LPLLDHQAALKPRQRLLYGGGVLRHFGSGVKAAHVIVDSQAAAGIECGELNARALQLPRQLCDTLHGCPKGVG
jgi:hypothetical protein